MCTVVTVKFQIMIKIPFKFIQLILVVFTLYFDPSVGFVGFNVEDAQMIDQLTDKLGFDLLEKRYFIDLLHLMMPFSIIP